MFKRTYYVQRAERRDSGDRVLRDTSFSSFMCVLFLFLLFTCSILIITNWRDIFLEKIEDVEIIEIKEPQSTQFEKIINYGRGIDDDENLSIWDVETTITTESKPSETPIEISTLPTTLLTDIPTSTLTLSNYTETSAITESTINPILTESTTATTDTSEFATETDITNASITNEIIFKATTESTLSSSEQSTQTSTTYQTEPTFSFDINDENDDRFQIPVTTNNWLFSRRTETSTTTGEEAAGVARTTSEDTLSSESRLYDIITTNNDDRSTTDWKRDAQTDETDLIDLETTESGNSVLNTGFKRELQTRAVRGIMTNEERFVGTTLMEPELTTVTVRPVNNINERSKVKKLDYDVRTEGTEKVIGDSDISDTDVMIFPNSGRNEDIHITENDDFK